jgi:hypothetical protein
MVKFAPAALTLISPRQGTGWAQKSVRMRRPLGNRSPVFQFTVIHFTDWTVSTHTRYSFLKNWFSDSEYKVRYVYYGGQTFLGTPVSSEWNVTKPINGMPPKKPCSKTVPFFFFYHPHKLRSDRRGNGVGKAKSTVTKSEEIEEYYLSILSLLYYVAMQRVLIRKYCWYRPPWFANHSGREV